MKLKCQKKGTCSLVYLQHSKVNSLQLLFSEMNEYSWAFKQQDGEEWYQKEEMC